MEVVFALSGAGYEIDLSSSNAEQLRAALARSFGSARTGELAERGWTIKRRTWVRESSCGYLAQGPDAILTGISRADDL